MYIKTIRKYCLSEKTTHTYFRLSESYRDEQGIARQRMVLGLGQLLELPDFDHKILFLERLNELIKGRPTLFSCKEEKVEQLAQHYYGELKQKKKIDRASDVSDDIDTVKLNTLKNRNIREVGAESLCYQALRQLGIEHFLKTRGWDDEQVRLAATHIISRTVYPASELKTVSWIKENSAVCELTGYDIEKVTKDKLYEISKKLYEEKSGLENHLSRCTNELFNLQDKIILYDLTNTYFEGRMKNSQMAKFGRSKEMRKDAKLIVLAVIINTEGFLKYSDIFEGNTSDCSTLKAVITALNQRAGYTNVKPIIVMDAGIATEENIQFLKDEKYDYLCVTRSNLKDYKADTGSFPVQIYDKKNQPIELLNVRVENDTDNYLWVKSEAKALKENSMNDQFCQRFEEGLRGIQKGIASKGGTKKTDKVWERIGRLKEKYSSTHQYYDITVSDNGKGTATSLVFQKKAGVTIDDKAGIYFLRTSLNGKEEQTLWMIYNLIREIEYTFRVLKTDLDLRPVYHKTDDASMAHLHLGLLAYWLVSTIRYQLKLQGINHGWSEIVRIMSTQKTVTTMVENSKGDLIQIRQCSEPTEDVQLICTKLKYRQIPMPRKKSVWHTDETFKNQKSDCQFVMDG
ncbi:MAG: Transposase, IS4 family protein [uncultured bacterium]|nr:MAG: Transposase, IS4 family protein [uncultured bacterium]